MRVSKWCCEDTAEDIIYEFETLLCNNDVKLNNLNPEENEFEDETSYINKKDYDNLMKKISRQLKEFAEYVEEKIEEAA